MADFSIEVKGLDQLEQLLKAIAKKVENGVSEMINQMLKDGEAYAINELGHIDTGETLDSISAYREGNKGIILAGGNAVWIEFGTGVAKNGAGINHPPLVEDNLYYGLLGHGEYEKGHGKNPEGWFYYDSNKKLHHTTGIQANMFLYHTYEALVDDLPDYAKEFVRKALSK